MIQTQVTIDVQTVSRGWRSLIIGVVLGAALAISWSYRLADDVVGDNLARGMLGQDANEMALTGPIVAMAFAITTGIAGSFTACNVAALCALTPMTSQGLNRGERLSGALRSIGLIAGGAVAVAAPYGAIAAWFGPNIPQLSQAVIGAGMPVRLVQSAIVFGLLGAAMLVIAALTVSEHRPPALTRLARSPLALVGVGALIGIFLIGRPFPLFMRLFAYAAQTHNPATGAATFALQALGNIVFVAAVMALVLWIAGDRLSMWLAESPGRMARVSAGSFAAAGTFLVLYWVVRVPAIFGFGWFPQVPWNG